MAATSKNRRNQKSAAMPVRGENWAEVVRAHLSKVREVAAVFARREDNVIHVYSVAREFKDNIYSRLLRLEGFIEKALPDLRFEFHVRAHQGREVSQAAPLGSEPLFLR